ncbi:T6SS effector BTH_I2691 family protein [Aquabacterium sp.]|uniref:T6SS effector BTH_I2691 family protein n=1 Tax=Aquabacterium sp. TaxID=1872578 RepID=UPI0025BF3EEE|nr:T6SS effector BTH_I2691 family protein [Aquabacterium sp.]
MSTQDCKFCNRQGLPLLPLRLAYVPKHTTSLPSTLTQGNPNLRGVTDGAYALRVINEGYVYMLDMRAGGFWRCFAATETGHFKELPLDTQPTQQPAFQCSRSGHATVASFISVERASEAGDVWIGYSRVWWTQAIRARIKGEASLRASLMVSLNAASTVTGGSLPAHSGVRLSSADQLASMVGEYAKDETAFATIDQRYANATTAGALPRHGQAESVLKAMHSISPRNAIVLALRDTVGIVQDINHWRNLQAGALAKYQGDAQRLEGRIIGDLILNLESSMKKQGQGDLWSKRFEPKVAMAKVRDDKKAHLRKVEELEAKITKASQDWCAWTGHEGFKQAWVAYDGENKRCGLALEKEFATCVFGSGGTKPEQAWWAQWLTSDPDDPNHALWIAFAAGDKDLLAFLKGDAAKPLDVGKLDKAVDVTKNGREVLLKLHEWRKTRKEKGLLRAAQQESGLLATSIASQLHILARTQPEQALQAGQRLRIIIASRVEVTITPHAQVMTMQQLVVQMHEAVWGPPKATLSKTVREARRLQLAQSVDGAWLGGRFTASKLVVVDAWLPDPALKLAAASASSASGVPPTIALPRQALNNWEGMTAYLKSLKGAPGGLMGVGAALQISNLSATLIQLDRATKGNAANRDDSITESYYGVVSGSLGLLALTGEVMAGTLAARAPRSVVTAAAARMLTAAGWTALGGGMLGAISGVVDLLQSAMKGVSFRDEGDDDAKRSSYLAAFSSGFGVVASGALAVIAAGQLLSAAGATSVAATAVISAGATLSVIPVAGWIALVIGATAAGVYFAWQASIEEDTPLEKWLSCCHWRNETKYANTTRIKFTSLKREMAEFQQAIYGISVTLNWVDRLGKDEVEVNVTMPGYSKNSDHAFLLELHGTKWARTLVHRKSSPYSSDPELKPQAPVQASMSATPVGKKAIPMSDVMDFSEPFGLAQQNGTGVFSGKIRVNENYFNTAKLKFEYWPDAVHHPELKMIPVPGGANFAETAD